VTNQPKRSTTRRNVLLPARLTWKDNGGTTRFAAVVMKNVSDHGAYVECQGPVSISLFRLAQLQLERDGRQEDGVPACLQQGRVLSAVYRVTAGSDSQPQGIALRLMVDPKRAATPASANIAQVLAS